MNSVNEEVRRIIDRTLFLVPDYWRSTLEQRIVGPKSAGSVFHHHKNIHELESVLQDADWQPYTHEAIISPARAFVTNDIGGMDGMVPLAKLPSSTQVILDDSKKTGQVSATVKGIRTVYDAFTVMIVGPYKTEDGLETEIVYTVHPGAPVRPLIYPGEHGEVITAEEAMYRGFMLAKVVGTDKLRWCSSGRTVDWAIRVALRAIALCRCVGQNCDSCENANALITELEAFKPIVYEWEQLARKHGIG